MELKGQYLQLMSQQAPKEFMELRRSGQLESHVQQVMTQAHQMLAEILASAPKDQRGNPTMQAEREAEEYVRAAFLEFPNQHPEPPDDLPDQTPQSRAATSSSRQAR